MTSALLVGVGVAGEAALAFALAAPALRGAGVGRARAVLAAALAAGALLGAAVAHGAAAGVLGAASLALPVARARHVLALALVAIAFAVRRAPAGVPSGGARRGAAVALAVAVALAWTSPETAAATLALSDAAALSGSAASVGAFAVCGAALAAAAGVALALSLERVGAGRTLPPSAVAASLFALKVLGPAAAAVQLPSLSTGLAAVVGRAVHDAVHVGFVVAQLPDHPFLRDDAYQLILWFLEPGPHAALTVALFTAPLLAAWRAAVGAGAATPPPDVRPPERRRARAEGLRRRRATALTFAIAVALAAGAAWTASAGADELYEPLPEPAVDDGGGHVVVALDAIGRRDRRMKKWAYAVDGRTVVFFALRRADGSVAIALDRCGVCLPKGYAQLRGEYVFCKHCRTPIPVGSVGRAGGCNPLPLQGASAQGSALRIPAAELAAAARATASEPHR